MQNLQVISRRQFIPRAALTVVGWRIAQAAAFSGVALTLESCNVFTDIENWEPVGKAAVNSILSVLTANGVLIAPGLQVTLNLIFAGFDALSAAITEYKSTTPAPVGALAKIETAFKDIVDNFTVFLKSLSISTPLVAIVVGIAQIIFSTIAAFMNRLPAASSLRRTVLIGSTVTVGSTTAPVVPKDRRTRRAFKKDFNKVLDGGPKLGVTIPPAAYLKVRFSDYL